METARNKMMDYLAVREHSEKELRQKLDSKFAANEIDEAIEFAKKKNWIPDSLEAALESSEKIAEELRRKGKGTHFINQYLEKKGLPEIKLDSSLELEKAKALVENKYSALSELSELEKAKAARFLMGRGFEEEIVRKVIYEEF